MIPRDQFGKKYYNKSPSADTASMLGRHHKKESKRKISDSNKIALREFYRTEKGQKAKEKLRAANKKQFQDPNQREIRRQKSLELWTDPEYRRRQSEKKRGKKQSREQIEISGNALLEKEDTTKGGLKKNRQTAWTVGCRFQ